ncbi:MAG: tryptophan synthase subunit alpha [Candidatus Omnitrophica bacterium]|nr:tryptophan synthase subunit alpha [Candidatus Omnitrophota bacterium]
MNRIDKTFKRLKKKRDKAFIAFITAGYPNLSATKSVVKELAQRGADIIELGVPFSDPLADGPTIQAASERALKNRVNLKSIFRLVKELRKDIQTPIALMTYYNPIFRYGLEKFTKDALRAGVDGVIVPDLPIDEDLALRKALRGSGIKEILFLAPTSTTDRIKQAARRAGGFIYYVSLTGVTGARKKLPQEIARNVRRIKQYTKTPVCVGFGISGPKQAEKIAKVADGVIVGSVLIKAITENFGKKDFIKRVGTIARNMGRAVHR